MYFTKLMNMNFSLWIRKIHRTVTYATSNQADEPYMGIADDNNNNNRISGSIAIRVFPVGICLCYVIIIVIIIPIIIVMS